MEESSIFECGHALLDIYVQSFLYSKIKLIRVRCLCQRVVGPAFVLEGFGTYMHALNSFIVVSRKLLHYPYAWWKLTSSVMISRRADYLRLRRLVIQ